MNNDFANGRVVFFATTFAFAFAAAAAADSVRQLNIEPSGAFLFLFSCLQFANFKASQPTDAETN